MYEAPTVVGEFNTDLIKGNAEVVWLLFAIPAWLAVLAYGGSWAWCTSVCGWGKVASCTNDLGMIKAKCSA